MSRLTYCTRVMKFCAAHRLHNPALSDEENRKQFGRCNHPSSHGHNYKIEATVEGEIVPEYGYAINLVDLKDIMFEVVDPLDHKNLDKDIPYFMQEGMISSAENLAIFIWDEMAKLLPSNVRMYNLRVHETDNNYIDYRG